MFVAICAWSLIILDRDAENLGGDSSYPAQDIYNLGGATAPHNTHLSMTRR